MLDVASRLAPGQVRKDYLDVYREQLGAGYTAVGEFHYLGLEEALAAAEAADEAGIAFVLLFAAYARGGIERFRQENPTDYLRQLESLRERGIRVGIAPHSVRACPRAWLEDLAGYAEREGLPLHVHADEQPREIEECLASQRRLGRLAVLLRIRRGRRVARPRRVERDRDRPRAPLAARRRGRGRLRGARGRLLG